MFYLNYQNGVNYNLVAQTPQYRMQSLQDLQNIRITGTGNQSPEILGDVANIQRGHEMAIVSEYNIRRVVDVYGAVQDRDLGSVVRAVDTNVADNQKTLPRGTFITVRGQVDTMRTSYIGLLTGLGFAIVLIYMFIVVNFQSWLGPFIIITVLPAALAGIVLCLFFTHTTLSVPALMGAIMCMGEATSNSILVVSFSRDHLSQHGDAVSAAIEAGATRFCPFMMTALAMIIGMIPMAQGLGDGGEQNAPLGRAVIGGALRYGRHPGLCAGRVQPAAGRRCRGRSRDCNGRERTRDTFVKEVLVTTETSKNTKRRAPSRPSRQSSKRRRLGVSRTATSSLLACP